MGRRASVSGDPSGGGLGGVGVGRAGLGESGHHRIPGF